METRDARADQTRVRRIAPFLVLILFAAGCGQEAKLRGIASRAVASDGRCSYIDASFDGPESYNCLYLISGTRMPIARAIARRLEHEGFAVGCKPNSEEVRVQGDASSVRALAVVTPRKTVYGARGFPIPSAVIHYGEPPIPNGSVLVKLDLAVHEAGGLDMTTVPCASPDAEPRTLPDCIRAWNSHANARLHSALAAARPRRLASVGAGPIEHRNTCVFTFKSGARYLMRLGHWRGADLVWTTRAFFVGSWSPGFDRDHIPNAVVTPDGRLRLRSRR
jgi:hypothetical protein